MMSMAPVQVSFYPDGSNWIAKAPDFDLATQGHTFEEDQFNLKDALFLFFESCIRRGTLAQVLAQAGYLEERTKQVEDYLADYIPPVARGAVACHA